MTVDRIRDVLALMVADPAATGGLWLRGRAGPLRDRVLAALAPSGARRLPPGTDEAALSGGLDLAPTLAQGRAVWRPGLLDRPGVLILPMAERCPAGLAARLAQAMDAGTHTLIALDESAGPDDALPAALADRLGLFLDLDGLSAADLQDLAPPGLSPQAPPADLPPEAVEQIVALADRLGVVGPRGVLATLAAARGLARAGGRAQATEADLARAAALTLAHRAAPMAEAPEDPPPPPPQPETSDTPDPPPDPDQAEGDLELLVAATRAALPGDLLAELARGRAARAAKAGAGSGAVRAGNRRGRPLPARPGRPDSPSALDLVATLRVAAPWQGYRRGLAAGGPPRALYLQPGDLRLRRVKECSDRVLIFAVDASGSSAMARLAEAKGAVELFLAGAYARRDHVALLSFRHRGAELMLPPTRSLAQTRTRLCGLPGGGGTPLAAGLRLALDTATRARARGMTPTIALLTDGKANIALDGRADRAQADREAQGLARAVAAAGVDALVLDVATRPQPQLAALAAAMGARYLALPRAGSADMAATLGAALEA